MTTKLILEESVVSKLYFLRGQKILLDFDLAELYQVSTKVFNQAVKRNHQRFPEDFMFKINEEEFHYIKSLNPGISGKVFSKHLPSAFTEQGVAMLSGILNSERAIQVNIAIMRAFVQMRSFIETNKDLIKKVAELEATMNRRLNENDERVDQILEAIRLLIKENSKPKRPIGFHLPDTN